MTWPLPEKLIRDFAASVDRLIVIEELDPFIEEAVKLWGIPCEGKSIFPLIGEFDPRVVRECAIQAGLLPESAHVALTGVEVGQLPARPPVLCPGCPHRSAFYVLNKLKVPVNGDIGCYTLGLSPAAERDRHVRLHGRERSAVAHGAAKAGSQERHVAVIGDSTFFHTGIPALLNVVYNHSKVTTIIMDNRITGMTGHQENPGSGHTLQGKVSAEVRAGAARARSRREAGHDWKGIDVEGIEKTLKEWIKRDEPAVLITDEECALLPSARQRWLPLEVIRISATAAHCVSAWAARRS